MDPRSPYSRFFVMKIRFSLGPSSKNLGLPSSCFRPFSLIAAKPRQDAPRRLQDAPKTAPRRPKTTPRHPKTPQDAPRPPQDAPKAPKTTPRRQFWDNFWSILGPFLVGFTSFRPCQPTRSIGQSTREQKSLNRFWIDFSFPSVRFLEKESA